MFDKNYANLSQTKDILDLIKIEYPDFEVKDWFFDIFIPLLEQKDIKITNNVLLFLNPLTRNNSATWNGKNFDKYNSELEKFLWINKMVCRTVPYDENISNEHEILQSEITNSAVDYRNGRNCYILTIEDFGDLIMNWKDECDRKVMKEYRMMENIKSKYIHECEIKRIDSNYNDLFKNMESKKHGNIYIATSRSNAGKNWFEIGATASLNDMKFAPDPQNEDDMYVCFHKRVYKMDKVQEFIQDILTHVRHPDNRKVYILHYPLLEEVVDLVIKNINETYAYVNTIITTRLKKSYECRPVIPQAIKVNEDEEMVLGELERQIEDVMNEYENEEKYDIGRNEILSRLNCGNLNKNKQWKAIKKHLKWKRGQDPIYFNGRKYRIDYYN